MRCRTSGKVEGFRTLYAAASNASFASHLSSPFDDAPWRRSARPPDPCRTRRAGLRRPACSDERWPALLEGPPDPVRGRVVPRGAPAIARLNKRDVEALLDGYDTDPVGALSVAKEHRRTGTIDVMQMMRSTPPRTRCGNPRPSLMFGNASRGLCRVSSSGELILIERSSL